MRMRNKSERKNLAASYCYDRAAIICFTYGSKTYSWTGPEKNIQSTWGQFPKICPIQLGLKVQRVRDIAILSDCQAALCVLNSF